MEQNLTFIVFILALLAVTLVCAAVPRYIRLNDKRTHLLLAFNSGIFLSALFLVLLPEGVEECEEAGFDTVITLSIIMIGFLSVFIIDRVLRYSNKSDCHCSDCMDHHSHGITSLSAFLGLAIHTAFDGIALAVGFLSGMDIGITVFIAMVIHKSIIIMSISSTMMLSDMRRSATIYMTVLCLVTPISAGLTYFVLGGVSQTVAGIALSLSAGIFMFVTMCDIIPEAFHREKLEVSSILLMILGILAMVVATLLMGIYGHIH